MVILVAEGEFEAKKITIGLQESRMYGFPGGIFVVMSDNRMLRKERVLFRNVPSAHLEKRGKLKVGPNLHGLIKWNTNQALGFSYADAGKNKGITWGKDILMKYFKNPKKCIPRTNIIFSGIKKKN